MSFRTNNYRKPFLYMLFGMLLIFGIALSVVPYDVNGPLLSPYRLVSFGFGSFLEPQIEQAKKRYASTSSIRTSVNLDELQAIEDKLETLTTPESAAGNKDNLTFVMVNFSKVTANNNPFAQQLAELAARPGAILSPSVAARPLPIDMGKVGNSAFVLVLNRPVILDVQNASPLANSTLGLESSEPVDPIGAPSTLLSGYRISRFGIKTVISPLTFTSPKVSKRWRNWACKKMQDWIKIYKVDVSRVSMATVTDPGKLVLMTRGQFRSNRGLVSRSPYKKVCTNI